MKRLTLRTRAALAALWHRPLLALTGVLLLSGPVLAAGPTGLLNDTGQTQCYDGASMVTCTRSNTGDTAPYPGQDGRFGRDAKLPPKVGGGAGGFDFTKICFNGDAQGTGTCTGTLAANGTGTATATGTPSTDWACTKDNVTNLIWSLQTGSGDWTTYAQTTLPNAHNTASRCGFNSGWRLPTRRELLGIVLNDGRNPAIDANYFPGMTSNVYWTSDVYAPGPSYAWFVDFSSGGTRPGGNTSAFDVRLVRSGQ